MWGNGSSWYVKCEVCKRGNSRMLAQLERINNNNTLIDNTTDDRSSGNGARRLHPEYAVQDRDC